MKLEEEMLEKKEDLIFLWLYKNEISFKEISEQYVAVLEMEREYYKSTLAKSDVYVATLIDGKKKEIDYQKPFAIKYMLDNKRLYGTKWYCKLKDNGVISSEQII